MLRRAMVRKKRFFTPPFSPGKLQIYRKQNSLLQLHLLPPRCQRYLTFSVCLAPRIGKNFQLNARCFATPRKTKRRVRDDDKSRSRCSLSFSPLSCNLNRERFSGLRDSLHVSCFGKLFYSPKLTARTALCLECWFIQFSPDFLSLSLVSSAALCG